MDFIKILREDSDLSDLLCDVCDVEILPEFKTPEDECGHLTYNISGKTFARAGSGSEYILLEDGSIGFWGSEGACGRIADSLQDFFEFVINCPYWQDYLDEDEYLDVEAYDLDTLCRMIYAGEIQDSKTVAAIMAYKQSLSRQQ